MHACLYLHMQEYYWWIKYLRFYPKIVNQQNLLLAILYDSSFPLKTYYAKEFCL